MTPIRMTSLRRAPNGDWFARKMVPEDVRQHPDGFWTINITPEAGTVKGNVARVVPLHEHLVDQGLIGFAQSKGNGTATRERAMLIPSAPQRRRWRSTPKRATERDPARHRAYHRRLPQRDRRNH